MCIFFTSLFYCVCFDLVITCTSVNCCPVSHVMSCMPGCSCVQCYWSRQTSFRTIKFISSCIITEVLVAWLKKLHAFSSSLWNQQSNRRAHLNKDWQVCVVSPLSKGIIACHPSLITNLHYVTSCMGGWDSNPITKKKEVFMMDWNVIAQTTNKGTLRLGWW